MFDTCLVDDLTALYNATTALYAHEGGDDPEYGMGAIDLTLKAKYSYGNDAMIAGSQIIVLTDAPAKDNDPAFVDSIIADAKGRKVCIHLFLSGCGDNCASYQRVQSETGGTIVQSSTNFNQILNEFTEFSTSYKNSPGCETFHREDRRKKRSPPSICHSFRVSVFTEVLKFLITTAQPHATVRKPNGETTRIDITGDFSSYKEVNPQSGEWSVCVDTGTLELTFNNFINFDLVVTYVKEGGTSETGIITTTQTPLACEYPNGCRHSHRS